jgi:replication factor C subunit 3/5
LPNKSDTVEATCIVSSHHIELSPSESGYHDRVIVQEVIKGIAESHHLDTVGGNNRPFKVVVLNEVDMLSKDAQNALRRTMEKYMTNCRLILCASSITKVIEALRSRCLCLRVAAPSYDEIVSIINDIGKKEGFTVPELLAYKIATKSARNLRRALLMLEATKVKQFPFTEDQAVQLPDWLEFTNHIGRIILDQQTPQQLLSVREKFYELLTHCIPHDVILTTLTSYLLEKVDNELKHEVIEIAATCEHRMAKGSKPIFHLEAFAARIMELYKGFMLRFLAE